MTRTLCAPFTSPCSIFTQAPFTTAAALAGYVQAAVSIASSYSALPFPYESARTGITQADISRIENGTRNPSLSMVKKLARGLGMQLKLEFIQTPAK